MEARVLKASDEAFRRSLVNVLRRDLKVTTVIVVGVTVVVAVVIGVVVVAVVVVVVALAVETGPAVITRK